MGCHDLVLCVVQESYFLIYLKNTPSYLDRLLAIQLKFHTLLSRIN